MRSDRLRPGPWIALLAAALVAGCEPAPEIYRSRFTAMGTLVDVNIAGVDPAAASEAAAAVEALFDERQRRWDPWGDGELAQINAALRQDGAVVLPDGLEELLNDAAKISRQSGARFDPAVGALTRLWGFGRDADPPVAPPDAPRIAALVADLRPITDLLDGGGRLTGDATTVIDLGGFAKGVAVDEAIGLLRRRGIEHAIVNAGGDLRATGKAGDRPWRIGIRHPRADGIIAGLEIRRDESIFTSGDYERFFEVGGRRFHHILDPATGYPAPDVSSVTVIHERAALADAAATALFVAGPQDWPRVAADLGLDQVMLIEASGRIHVSPAMRERLWFPGDGPRGDQIVLREIP